MLPFHLEMCIRDRFGKGEPVIYIDGRKQTNTSGLSLLSSTNVKSVQLITNPGAEYDAEDVYKRQHLHEPRLPPVDVEQGYFDVHGGAGVQEDSPPDGQRLEGDRNAS